MIEFIRAEIARCQDAMRAADPCTEGYLRAFQAMESLCYALDREVFKVTEPDPDAVVPPPEKSGCPCDTCEGVTCNCEKHDPEHDAPAPEEKDKATPDKVTVRAALAQARNEKGVDVGKLLASIGYDSFPAVPAEKYADLMDALNKELEGK